MGEEACFRSLLLATVLLRLARNLDWGFLLPRVHGARALTFRRLPTRDSACIAMVMNHTFAGMAGGATYSFTPLLRRVDKKAGIRVTAPYATAHPEEWRVAFSDRSFLPSREPLPSFKFDAAAGWSFGALFCNTEVAFYSCFTSRNFR